MSNKFIKILCSLPVLLIFLYFLPFVGICLIILRSFVYKDKSKVFIPIILITFGILIYMPRLLGIDFNTIPYLKEIINNELYNNNFLDYAKYLITGVIFLIISFVLESLVQKFKTKMNREINNYVDKSIKKTSEVSQKNDIKIKEKQQKLKNTSYVKCPKCGSDNIIDEKFGTCQYCRSKIENKNYKE